MTTIIYYGAPAYGHTNPSLPYVEALVKKGHDVIYYSVDEFKAQILRTGAQYHSYPDSAKPYLSVGLDANVLKKYPWRLASAILEMIDTHFPLLLSEAEKLQPALIIHDSIISPGRFIAQKLDLPAICFNTFVPLTSTFKPSWWAYSKHYLLPLISDAPALPHYLKMTAQIKKKYALKNLNLPALFYNKEAFNILSFAPELHPDFPFFEKNYFFAGPLALLQPSTPQKKLDEFVLPRTPFIYATLGTVVSSEQLISKLIEQLSSVKMNVLLVTGKNVIKQKLPKNIQAYDFLPQAEILPKASLVITTGGMNTLNEALRAQTPLIILPFLGEQKVNADHLRKMGLALYLKNPSQLKEAVISLMNAESSDQEDMARHLTETRLEKAIAQTEKYLEKRQKN